MDKYFSKPRFACFEKTVSVPGMNDSSWVRVKAQVPDQPDGGEGLATRKGVRREAGFEGSVVQKHGPTDRNLI